MNRRYLSCCLFQRKSCKRNFIRHTLMAKEYPEPVVGAFVFNEEGEILLIKSPKWSNQWTVPGGHIEAGEAIGETVRREVKEETGIDTELVEVFNVQESIFDEKFHTKKHFIFLDCTAKAKTSDLKPDGREAVTCKWFSCEEALRLPDIALSAAIPIKKLLFQKTGKEDYGRRI